MISILPNAFYVSMDISIHKSEKLSSLIQASNSFLAVSAREADSAGETQQMSLRQVSTPTGVA